MHYLLERLFQKRNISDITELKPEEKVEYERWAKILSRPQLSLADITQFCEAQKAAIEAQWRNLDNSQQKNERLILLHVVYGNILSAISGDESERRSVEQELNELLTR